MAAGAPAVCVAAMAVCTIPGETVAGEHAGNDISTVTQKARMEILKIDPFADGCGSLDEQDNELAAHAG